MITWRVTFRQGRRWVSVVVKDLKSAVDVWRRHKVARVWRIEQLEFDTEGFR